MDFDCPTLTCLLDDERYIRGEVWGEGGFWGVLEGVWDISVGCLGGCLGPRLWVSMVRQSIITK